jgi:DNA-binding LytR/AlgR family response regulator
VKKKIEQKTEKPRGIVFEFLDSINHTKKDIMTDENEKQYNAYVVNHFLSGSVDAVLPANEMNCLPFLDKRLQYDYLKHSIRKQRRYTKWLKNEKTEDLQLIQKYFSYNIEKARDVVNILSKEEMQKIREHFYIGGIK